MLHLPSTRRPLTSAGTAVLGLSLLALSLTACGS